MMLGLGTGWEVPYTRQCFVWAAATVILVQLWSYFFCKKRLPHTLTKRSKKILVQNSFWLPQIGWLLLGSVTFSELRGMFQNWGAASVMLGAFWFWYQFLAHNSFPFHHATCCSQNMDTKIKVYLAKTCFRLQLEWLFPFSLGKKCPNSQIWPGFIVKDGPLPLRSKILEKCPPL